MLTGTYLCTTLLRGRERHATIRLDERPGGALDASFTALKQTFRARGACDGDAFVFEGRLRVLLKVFDYRVQGSVAGDELMAAVRLGDHELLVRGVRQ